jgi:hypothetical protein
MNAGAELARCDREIAAMRAQDPVRPAYLVTLGIADWERERALILEGFAATPRAADPRSHKRSKTMKERLKVRQGDVLFLPVAAIPGGERKKRENGVAAYGEVTGHSHRLADLATAEVFELGEGLFVRVSDEGISIGGEPGATFVHEEHGPANLSPGNYEIRIQREYSPEEIRNVVD